MGLMGLESLRPRTVKRLEQLDIVQAPERSYATIAALTALAVASEATGFTSDIFGSAAEAGVFAKGFKNVERFIQEPVRRKVSPGVTSFLFSTADELLQRAHIDNYGAYDAKDFLWYTIGLLLWIGIAKRTNRSQMRA